MTIAKTRLGNLKLKRGDVVSIEVTKHDIAAGVKCNGMHCPIAVAALRMGFRDAIIGRYEAELIVSGNLSFEDCQLPESAVQFTRRFDGGDVVEPQTFEIKLA